MLGSDGWDAIDIETDDDLLAALRAPHPGARGRRRRSARELVITRPDVEEALGADDPGDPPPAPVEPAVAAPHRRPRRAPRPGWPRSRSCAATPTGAIGRSVGQPAPALERSTTSTAATWTLADADGRLVWVNFWATSCEPCRTEMPAMQRLAEDYADELLVLGVNWGEERERGRRLRGALRRRRTRSCSTPASRSTTTGPAPMGCRATTSSASRGHGPARGRRAARSGAHGRDRRRAPRRSA